MTEELQQLRDKDRAVLHHVSEGRTDTHQITQATTLKAHEVRYSLKKLQELNLVDIEKPDGMVERVVQGQKRVFKAPLRVELTDQGRSYLEDYHGGQEQDSYENLTHQELVRKIHQLEVKVSDLEESLELFRKQVLKRLED